MIKVFNLEGYYEKIEPKTEELNLPEIVTDEIITRLNTLDELYGKDREEFDDGGEIIIIENPDEINKEELDRAEDVAKFDTHFCFMVLVNNEYMKEFYIQKEFLDEEYRNSIEKDFYIIDYTNPDFPTSESPKFTFEIYKTIEADTEEEAEKILTGILDVAFIGESYSYTCVREQNDEEE